MKMRENVGVPEVSYIDIEEMFWRRRRQAWGAWKFEV